MDKPKHILVVDDYQPFRDMVETHLIGDGYRVSVADKGSMFRDIMTRDPADLAIIDLMLPDESGLSLVRFVRERYRCGVIMLTTRTELIDRVVGLEVGADDYMSKPYEPRELLARVHSVLRRVDTMQPPRDPPPVAASRDIICFAQWRLDLGARHLIAGNDEIVELTSGEFNLLNEFIAKAGNVLSREYLLQVVHSRNWDYFDRSIDVLVTRLRKKLEVAPDRPAIIKTVRGAGYLFAADVKR